MGRILRFAFMFMILFSVKFTYAQGRAEPIYFFATYAGGKTLDRDALGGNPFASAFVELTSRKEISLEAFKSDLVNLTIQFSQGYQSPEVRSETAIPNWQILPKPAQEKRVALLLVNFDYSATNALISLRGAEFDLKRVRKSLELAGFDVQIKENFSRFGAMDALHQFAMKSASADVALIYATGHGAEFENFTYLLPTNFPAQHGKSGLDGLAIKLDDMAQALHASKANMLFYAGCRNYPFQ